MNLLLGGALAYTAAIGTLYLAQGTLLFPRAAAGTPTHPLPRSARTIELLTADGHKLVGYHLRSAGPSRGLVLGFAGNAWNALDCLAFLAARLAGFDLAVFHYRGYRPSEGRPGERAFFADAMFIHDTLVERLRPEKVFAVGFSLGSGVAAYLASVRQLTGLVLVTPFDSIRAIARRRYFWVPVDALLKHPFASVRHLAGRDVPTAVIMAGDDRIIPAARSRRLVAVLRRPVLVETIPGTTHCSIYDHRRFDELLLQAMELLATDATARADVAGQAGPAAAAEWTGVPSGS